MVSTTRNITRERKYTTAVDLWGLDVFAELFTGKPILVGKSDSHQAQIVFELVGSPLTWTDAAKLPNKMNIVVAWLVNEVLKQSLLVSCLLKLLTC